MLKDNNQSKVNCCSVDRQTIEKSVKSMNERHSEPIKERKTSAKNNMVLISGGSFLMGTNDQDGFPADGEGPVREVTLDDFFIGMHTVTNREFLEFVNETRYTTDAEKFGWSFVFEHLISKQTAFRVTQKVQHTPWWWVVHGADFKHPEGPDSDIDYRMDHPVVHVSWNDAVAYCEWSGYRLPTEAEWEYAARGGLDEKRYPWGDELKPSGEHHCNIWQGTFPHENTQEDGYFGTAPVESYPPNGYGLYNMAGNVWEWCADWFSKYHPNDSTQKNPIGPQVGSTRIMRGGSYLCHQSYCNRYRVAARTSNTPDSSSGNLGFRCVRSK